MELSQKFKQYLWLLNTENDETAWSTQKKAHNKIPSNIQQRMSSYGYEPKSARMLGLISSSAEMKRDQKSNTCFLNPAFWKACTGFQTSSRGTPTSGS
eukprot:g79126.t1